MASGDRPEGPPLYTRLRKGRWYWEPPLRLRRSHGLKVKPLGANTPGAWNLARKYNKELAGLDPEAPLPGSVAFIFAAFLASEKFAALAASTQGDYRWLAKRLSALPIQDRTLGRLSARTVRARHADLIYAQLKREGGHTSAHYACRFARRVWKWAARRELVDEHPNPWAGMELASIPERHQKWTRAQVDQVIAAAAELGRPSVGLAVILAYFLAHRQGDVLTLTWSQLDAGERKTAKTGAHLPIVVSAYPELATAVETARRGRAIDSAAGADHVVVCEATGRPWQVDTFRHAFREVADQAGIPAELQFRDLRATAATELKDAGADVLDMSTHTGHRTVSMARRYARPTAEQFERAAEKRRTARKPPRNEA